MDSIIKKDGCYENKKRYIFFPSFDIPIFLIWASIFLGTKSLEMSVILVEILFVFAGFLLSKRLIIGGVIGMFPSIYSCYQKIIPKQG